MHRDRDRNDRYIGLTAKVGKLVIMLAHFFFFVVAGMKSPLGLAQSLVKDFLSGISIISENQYRVGDIIEVVLSGLDVK